MRSSSLKEVFRVKSEKIKFDFVQRRKILAKAGKGYFVIRQLRPNLNESFGEQNPFNGL